MLNINSVKEQIKSTIVIKFAPIEGLNSITFVGSFESSTDISIISDIDIVVIVNELSQTIFNEIVIAAGSIKGNDIGLDEYRVKLNMTFGPLKFNDYKTIVFHIMVYDIVGHRKHVLESPFTCLDWEYFPAIYGKNLSEIYPASGVQLEDLVGSRRGLESYLEDLKKKVISYREYDFSSTPYSEKKYTFQIDDRHQKEYAYHVLKFLQINLIKILFQENKKYTISEINTIFSSLNSSFKNHSDLLLELHEWKYEYKREPIQIFERLEYFIEELSNWLKKIKLPQVTYIRHAKTIFNDGSFLGVRRDPPIIKPVDIQCQDSFDEVYTGTLKRTIETGNLLKSNVFIEDRSLNEIDYGLAEGMKIEDLFEKFPEIVKSWKQKEDPKFPEGECQIDVQNRLLSFINKGVKKNNTAVITHNVVLRTLLGKVYQQPVYKWYKINPKHLEPHNFQIFKNTLIPKFTKEQQIKYKDELVDFQSPIIKYGIFWIPNEEIKQYIENCKEKVRRLESDAIYLNHPVHVTFFLFHAFEHEQSEIISNINNIKISFSVESSKIFENDLITKGDTLVIGLKPTQIIIDSQKNLAESLLNFVRKPVIYQNTWEGKYKESYDKYGFPFVGSHWIPHLTIASVKSDGKFFINEIKSTTINFIDKSIEGHLALYKISGDNHQLIHTWQ